MVNLWISKNDIVLANIEERVTQSISLPLSNQSATTSLISGKLPPGLRLSNNRIIGTALEVSNIKRFRFVIRATHGDVISDRTFSIIVNGEDPPVWITPEGLLPIGENNQYFILDSSPIDYQLSVTDPDLSANETIKFYIGRDGGELPPGISLTEDGRLIGIVDPLLSLDIDAGDGGFDSNPYSKYPLDFGINRNVQGLDSFFYDFTLYDFGVSAVTPRKLNRYYQFIVTATDGITEVKRSFRIYLVGDDYLKADNTIMKIGNGIFTSDATNIRRPVWITPANLGVRRANNYTTIFLDIINPPTLAGIVFYRTRDINDDGSPSEIPPGLELDHQTGELFGKIPYQPAISREYKFTVTASRYFSDLDRAFITGNFYEDTVSGVRNLKINKLPEGTNDGLDDLYALVGRTVSIEQRQYTIENVIKSNPLYDELVLKTPLQPKRNLDPLVLERNAENQNYFFVEPISDNSKHAYTGRTMLSGTVQEFQIENIYPYIEWEIAPVSGSTFLSIPGRSGENIKTVIEEIFKVHDYDAYAEVIYNGSNISQATLIRMLIPSTAANRNKTDVRNVFASNNSASVVINNVANPDRVKLVPDHTISATTPQTYKLAVLRGNSFSEEINVAQLETAESSKTFTLTVLGEIESTITWKTASNLGEILTNRPSTLAIRAETTLVDSNIKYSIISGKLPPGLQLLSNGEISGKVVQFGSDDLPGLVRFDLGNTTFDDNRASFDRVYKFTAIARDRFGFSAVTRDFSISVRDADDVQYSNIYMKPLLSTEQRSLIETFINDVKVFDPELIYRLGDANFGLQKELKTLVFAGIETKTLDEFHATIAKNHRRKRFYFGNLRTAVAKIPGSNEVVYEVVYLELKDPKMTTRGKTKDTFTVKNANKLTIDNERKIPKFEFININDNTITVDSNAVSADQNAITRLFMSNLEHMRDRIAESGKIGEQFLPLWMRTQQADRGEQVFYIPAVPLCYTLPGKSQTILENIVNSGFDFSNIDYDIDRYVVDNVTSNVGERYIMFANYKYNA
jgi:hypothetical protein